MENNNGFDMSRPASAWVKKPGGPATQNVLAPPRPAVPEPKRFQWPAGTTGTERVSVPRQPARPDASAPAVVWSPMPGFAIRAIRPQSLRLMRNLAGAGAVFLVSVIAVVAIAALVPSRSSGASTSNNSPKVGPELQAALSGVEVRNSAPDSPVSPEMAPIPPGPTESVSLGSIRIPAIGIEAQFYPGVHDAAVEKGPGLWPGTPLPGSPGNSVMAGHRTTHTHPFRDLDALKPGDVIETTGGSDAVTEFRVVSVETIRESEYVEYVLANPQKPGDINLTLFACAPKGSSTHRIVVRASAAPAANNERGDA